MKLYFDKITYNRYKMMEGIMGNRIAYNYVNSFIRIWATSKTFLEFYVIYKDKGTKL